MHTRHAESRYASFIDIRTESINLLEEERRQFRSSLPADLAALWKEYSGRIAVVLSGGGARGAYEAGVLLALQDAALPTHILTSTSIGAINAASYAAHGRGYLGKAEPLIQGWLDLTPATLGIDWSRYIIVIAGFIAATAGFGNAAADLLHRFGVFFHQYNPLLTWLFLGVAGTTVFYNYTDFSYLFYVLVQTRNRHRWVANKRKVIASLTANLVVLGFLIWVLASTHVEFREAEIFEFSRRAYLWFFFGLLCTILIWWMLRDPLSRFSQKLLRSPLHSGLFQNYDRTRFLKNRIHPRRLRRSPMRVVMTAAELYTGREKYFVNKRIEELQNDPGADAAFIQSHFEYAPDPMRAVIASSAFPMAYEPVKMHGGLWSDGGLVAKQPIIPAIRLGADVVFLVAVEAEKEVVPKIKTFLDVGMRAFDILMSRNVQSDLRVLESVNKICETYAARVGCRPEQLLLEIGDHQYRYLKAFTIRPATPLAATLLDFDGRIVRPAIEQGYRDGCMAVQAFIEYLAESPAAGPKHLLRLNSEQGALAAT